MPFFWIILTAGIVGIIATEWTLWRLFERRVKGLHLHLSSTTGRRVFTAPRIRVCVVLHTALLLCAAVLSLLFLW